MACDSLPCQNNGLCVYAGGEKEFTCECPESYVGDVCQYKGELLGHISVTFIYK